MLTALEFKERETEQFDSHLRAVAQNRHQWVTVLNPIERRELLRACDNCGVVKSQNTMRKACAVKTPQRLISGSLRVLNG